MSGYVRIQVPRVVAELLGLTTPTPAPIQEVTPVVLHDNESIVIRRRVQATNLLADAILTHPTAWGVWPDEGQRRLLASRLLDMRERVRACAIREAAEVAAL